MRHIWTNVYNRYRQQGRGYAPIADPTVAEFVQVLMEAETAVTINADTALLASGRN